MPPPASNNGDSKPNLDVDWFLRDRLPQVPLTPDRAVNPLSSKQDKASLHAILQDQLPVQNQQPDDDDSSHVLQRSRSLPVNKFSEKKKGGFFKRLFATKKETKTGTPIAKNIQPQRENESASPPSPQVRNKQRSKSVSAADLDPKLESFLNYYKKKGLDQLQKDLEHKSDESSIVSSSQTSISPSTTSTKTDVLGRPIPPHPAKAPLPSALVKNSYFERSLLDQKSHLESNAAQTSSKLNFLRRHITNDPSVSRSGSIVSSTKDLHIPAPSTTALSTTGSEPVAIPGLEDLPKLKVVAFDVPVFINDPPQQIPSRTPRKGEVEIMPDGSIVIHKLTVAERRQIINSAGGGIVVGGSGPLKIISKDDRDALVHLAPEPVTPPGRTQSNEVEVENNDSVDSEESNSDEEDKDKKEDEESKRHDAQRHSIEVAVAATAASARGKQTPNELKRTVTNNEDEVGVDAEATKINIDKPMARHKSSVSLYSANVDIVEEINSGKADVPLDVLYTRCCHLREILPIPAMLKQLKPGSTDPISVLQLRNPKPSLVEVLTFSDFISVAPVLCVSLDGVSLSSDMFRIILSSLTHKKELEKFTLRNTPIDELGWKLLCWFLTKNKNLSRLDLSQVPSLKLNIQKPSKAITPNIKRMESDPNSRSDMNWNLFNAVLVYRGGIDELVLNGAKMSNQHFENLIEMGVSLSTTKLGLAYNELTSEQCDVLSKHLNFERMDGIDLAYNDLHGKIHKFVNAVEASSTLRFISLNSTNLSDDDGEVSHLVGDFLKFKNLSYIDFSNNKKLFPRFMMTLSEVLPVFPKLIRVHLDDNDLNQEALVLLAEIIPFCKSLSHISLAGNKFDTVSAAALCQALKISHSVVTVDLDYEQLPPKFGEKIALYTVRNMHTAVYGHAESNNEMNDLQHELVQLLGSDEKNPPGPELLESFVTKASKFKTRIHETIEDLFRLRIQGQLSVEGKETLIRFCFIDTSIDKGLKLLRKRAISLNSELKERSDILLRHGHKVGPGELIDNPSGADEPKSLTDMPLLPNESVDVELLPFGISQSNGSQEHPDTEEIKDDSKARASDMHQIKEEASMLKLSNLIRSDMEKNLSEDNIQKVKDLSKNISGERFREILLRSGDLNSVIEALDSLKANGIPLKDIYQKNANHDDGGLILEKLKSSSTTKSSDRGAGSLAGDSNAHIDGSDTASETESEEEEEGLDEAYDEILDHLVRVRTVG